MKKVKLLLKDNSLNSRKARNPTPAHIGQRLDFKTTDEDWKVLSKLRIFRPDEHVSARKKIDRLLTAFGMYKIRSEDLPAMRRQLAVMIRAVSRMQKNLTQMLPLSVDKFYQLGGNALVTIYPHDAALAIEQLTGLEEMMLVLVNRLKEAAADFPSRDSRRTPEEVLYFVGGLNEIVHAHSDGGPLKRSDINWEKGNDVQFVNKVLEIAQRKYKKSYKLGTIMNAIRRFSNQDGSGNKAIDDDLPGMEVDHLVPDDHYND